MEDYLKLLRSIYDFNSLSHLLRRQDFKFTFDGMHGVSGPYAKRIFVQACTIDPMMVVSWQCGMRVLAHQ